MDTSNTSTFHAEAPAGAARAVAAISTELMKNYECASAVSAGQRFVAAQDSNGDPLLFSISSDHRFTVIRRDPKSPTGFSLVDLSSALGADLEAAVFEVSQDLQGNITLALALHPRGAPERSQLHVSPALSNDPAVNDFSGVSKLWVHRPLPGDARITHILMGTSDDAHGAPLTLAAVKGSREATHLEINADAADRTWSSKPFPLPENADEIFDLAVGRMKGDRGVYVLYRVGALQTLTFAGLPDPDFPDKRRRHDFKLPCKARCIAAAPREDGVTDLYVAGEGIHLFERSGATSTVVAGADKLGAVERLLVRGDAENVSVWAVNGGGLSFVQARRSALGAWSEPIVLSRGARQIDALRDKARLTNALFAVRADGELEYHYQDGGTGLWKTAPMALPSTGRLRELDTYTSQITLSDDKGKVLAGARIALRASERTHVSVNGAAHILGPDADVEVDSDVQGRITVLCPVSSLSSPSFHVRSAALSVDRRFDPAAKVLKSLSKVRSGADFLELKGRDGKPLGDNISAAKRDEAAKGLGRLVKMAGSLPQGGAQGPMMFAAAAEGDGDDIAQADSAPLEPWGMDLSGDNLSYKEGADALSLMIEPADACGAEQADAGPAAFTGGVAPVALIADAGSLLRALITGAEKALSFFIDEAYHLVVKIGDKLRQIAITVAEQVYEVVHWVLKETLNIDLDDLIHAVGHIFSWRDIVVTHDVLANLVRQFMLLGEREVDKVEGKVKEFFGGVRARLRSMTPVQAAGLDLGGSALDASGQLYASSPRQQEEAKVSAYLSSPAGGFAGYHLTHARPIAPVTSVAEKDPLRAMLADVAEVWGKIDGTLKQLGMDLGAGFLDGKLSINELIAKLTGTAALGLLDVFEAVIVKLLASGRRLITMARELIDRPLQIPVLSALYESWVGGKMSILGAAALLIAMPVTTVYKLLTGEAPFPFVPVTEAGPAAFDAGVAAASSEHSAHPRHNGKAEKPRTYGLETVVAAGLLPLIGAGGFAVIKILSKIDCINKAIIKPLYDMVDRAKIAVAPLAPLLMPVMFLFKAILWVGKCIWLTLNAIKGFKPLQDSLRFARWAIGGLGVLAEFMSTFDPTEKASCVVRVIGTVLDVLVAIPYAVARIVEHAAGDDKWLIGVDVFELLGGVIDCGAAISTAVSKLIDEPTVKAASGAIALALTAWSIGNTIVISVTPVLLDKLHEPMF